MSSFAIGTFLSPSIVQPQQLWHFHIEISEKLIHFDVYSNRIDVTFTSIMDETLHSAKLNFPRKGHIMLQESL